MNKKDIFIYGAGPSGIELIELIKIINLQTKKSWNVKGFIEKDKKLIGKKIKNIRVIDQSKIKKDKEIYAICSITNPIIKEKLFSDLKKKFKPTNLIHPNIYIPDDLKIGIGNIIFSNVHLSYNVQISDNCYIGFGCDVGHDAIIERNCSIMPGTIINGNSKLMKNCFVGSGSLISVNVKIGKNCRIGSGTNIFKNILSNNSVYEIPRLIKKRG